MFPINEIRKDFPIIKNNPNMIYFDSGATSFKPEVVIDKVKEYYEFNNTNIHRGDYDMSYKISKAYDDTRFTLQKFINSKSEKEIVFTSGDTASLNTVAFGYGYYNLNKGDVILTTLSEHASNILPWFRLAELKGCKIEYIKLNDDGTFNIDNYRKCFESNSVKLVSITYVSNVLGYIYPIKEIARIAHENNAIVSVDGAQAAPHIEIDVQDLDVDFLSFSSHKMLGPSGVGVLYGKYNLLEKTQPLLLGGGSNARFDMDGSVTLKNAPEKFESGTFNIEGVLGFNEAVKYLSNIGMNKIHEYDKELVSYLLEKLSKLENVTIYNPKTETGIVSFNINGIFAQDAASYLNSKGICVRSGNHCAKILHNVIGVNESIRVSLYLYNTFEEIDKFIDVVKETTLEKCIGAVI